MIRAVVWCDQNPVRISRVIHVSSRLRLTAGQAVQDRQCRTGSAGQASLLIPAYFWVRHSDKNIGKRAERTKRGVAREGGARRGTEKTN